MHNNNYIVRYIAVTAKQRKGPPHIENICGMLHLDAVCSNRVYFLHVQMKADNVVLLCTYIHVQCTCATHIPTVCITKTAGAKKFSFRSVTSKAFAKTAEGYLFPRESLSEIRRKLSEIFPVLVVII